MKTINIPEAVLPILIQQMCQKEGSLSLQTVKEFVNQSGLDMLVPVDQAVLNTIMVINGTMPNITESLPKEKVVGIDTYIFDKYYSISQLVVAKLADSDASYTFSLEDWLRKEEVE